MSACAIPVDWVFARALAAVSAPDPVDVELLMADCDLDRDEAITLLSVAAYQVYGEAYLAELAEDVVLH